MIYPNDFIEKAKKVYPDTKTLHYRITKGDAFIGNFLEHYDIGPIPAREILSKIQNNQIQELKDQAQHLVDKSELYKYWCDIKKESEKKWKILF